MILFSCCEEVRWCSCTPANWMLYDLRKFPNTECFETFFEPLGILVNMPLMLKDIRRMGVYKAGASGDLTGCGVSQLIVT